MFGVFMESYVNTAPPAFTTIAEKKNTPLLTGYRHFVMY